MEEFLTLHLENHPCKGCWRDSDCNGLCPKRRLWFHVAWNEVKTLFAEIKEERKNANY